MVDVGHAAFINFFSEKPHAYCLLTYIPQTLFENVMDFLANFLQMTFNALDTMGEWSRPRLTGCRRDRRVYGLVHSPTLNLLAARRATSVAQNVWQL